MKAAGSSKTMIPTTKLQNIIASHHRKPLFILSEMKASTLTTMK